MATRDTFRVRTPFRMRSRLFFEHANGYKDETLTGTFTLTNKSAHHQRLDANGADRNVVLPAEETNRGDWYEIINTAAGAFNLVIQNDALVTVVTVNQNEKCKVICNGTAWTHMGVETIALT
jgi:hypothetical protein